MTNNAKMVDALSFTSFHNIVEGKARGSDTTHHGVDPATRSPLWNIPTASEQDVNDAVLAANTAFRSWRAVPFEARVNRLRMWGEGCRLYLEQFGELVSTENGKPVSHLHTHSRMFF